MIDNVQVTFRQVACVRGRENSWAEYEWDSGRNRWYKMTGQSSSNFFLLNPEFEHTMCDSKMTLYSLK
jgi:hypothetical protein